MRASKRIYICIYIYSWFVVVIVKYYIQLGLQIKTHIPHFDLQPKLELIGNTAFDESNSTPGLILDPLIPQKSFVEKKNQ